MHKINEEILVEIYDLKPRRCQSLDLSVGQYVTRD
jgi:hypothetical protein